MLNTLEYIQSKYNLDYNAKQPIEIPNAGRDNLADLFRELNFNAGVELGVEQGIYSEILCKANPNLKLYCVDAWTAYREYRDHVSQDKLNKFYEEAKTRLSAYNCEIINKFSMEAVKQFENNSLDFIYIDANHEIPWVIEDIFWWSKKVRPGGIISGHDYYESKRKNTKCHVKYAVDCYVRSYRISPWFLLGMKEKNGIMIRDHSRSWFWIKI
jgi:predicted O-methyltransferase YrrM